MVRWHAAYTRPAAEALVDQGFRARGFRTLFLHDLVEVRHARQTQTHKRPLFSRYCLAGVEHADELAEIRATPGVLGVVGDSKGALSIRERDIEKLRQLGDETGRLRMPMQQMRELLSPGTRVRVRGYLLEPVLAFVLVDRGKEIDVRLRLFKRWVRGTFDRKSIEVASPKRPATSDPVK
jgi:transcription antitermination factor NusG